MTYQSHPLRIQRKRTKGYRMPAGAIYCGRPTRWGNPFEKASTFEAWIRGALEPVATFKRATMLNHIHELRSKRLACWCPLDKPCHVDILAIRVSIPPVVGPMWLDTKRKRIIFLLSNGITEQITP